MDTVAKATFFDPDGNEVVGYEYRNPDGSTGGWVALTAIIGENVTIETGATVGPEVVIAPGARIRSGAAIYADMQCFFRV